MIIKHGKFGIPTEYKGIQMRSRLEGRIAFLLDKLNLRWQYEPKSFLLLSGRFYTPDFYLPDINTWIEGKGLITDEEKRISLEFMKEKNANLILFSMNKILFFSSFDKWNDFYDDCIHIGKCSHCGVYFFTTNLGWYACRHCGAHEGDHDIKYCCLENGQQLFSEVLGNYYEPQGNL